MIIRFDSPFSATKRDCARCSREGKSGIGRSSPSDRSPALATTLNATSPTRFGAVT